MQIHACLVFEIHRWPAEGAQPTGKTQRLPGATRTLQRLPELYRVASEGVVDGRKMSGNRSGRRPKFSANKSLPFSLPMDYLAYAAVVGDPHGGGFVAGTSSISRADQSCRTDSWASAGGHELRSFQPTCGRCCRLGA